MFDIGFLELLVCAIIALLVLGPERLPVAARAAGRWVGKARRMVGSFTTELDRQLKAEELREKIRKEGSELGAEEIQRNFQEGLNQARKYTDYVVTGDHVVTEDYVVTEDQILPENQLSGSGKQPAPADYPEPTDHQGQSRQPPQAPPQEPPTR